MVNYWSTAAVEETQAGGSATSVEHMQNAWQNDMAAEGGRNRLRTIQGYARAFSMHTNI
jgi:hypothetical protein